MSSELNGEALALQRAMGRLEGRIESYNTRQANFEITIGRQIELVAKEVMAIRENAEQFKLDKSRIEQLSAEFAELKNDVAAIKTSKSLILGGWTTVMWVATAIAGTVTFVIFVLEYLMMKG